MIGTYIHMRHCNPISNLLCTANLVLPILLVDEKWFCQKSVSVMNRSHLKKKMNLGDLLLQWTTDQSVFPGQLGLRFVLLFVWFSVCGGGEGACHSWRRSRKRGRHLTGKEGCVDDLWAFGRIPGTSCSYNAFTFSADKWHCPCRGVPPSQEHWYRPCCAVARREKRNVFIWNFNTVGPTNQTTSPC